MACKSSPSDAIKLVPIRISDKTIISNLEQKISQYLGLDVMTIDMEFDATYAHDPSRDQYNSSEILLGLKHLMTSGTHKVIAVTELDLFIPILTFVFGEAQLNGRFAVVSTFRLRPEYYGLPRDDALVGERLLKETIHELGHTFGLRHCPDYNCVLHASTFVDEIDLKTSNFCPDCQEKLDVLWKNEPL